MQHLATTHMLSSALSMHLPDRQNDSLIIAIPRGYNQVYTHSSVQATSLPHSTHIRLATACWGDSTLGWLHRSILWYWIWIPQCWHQDADMWVTAAIEEFICITICSYGVESPQHAVANLMCVECGKLVACTDECVYTWLYPLGIAMINESFCLSGKCMLSALDSIWVVARCCIKAGVILKNESIISSASL